MLVVSMGMAPELVAAEQFCSGSAQVLGVAVGLTRRFLPLE